LGGRSNRSLWLKDYKIKNKAVVVARQQLHFLCSDKENEAKENFLLAEGYALNDPAATSIQVVPAD